MRNQVVDADLFNYALINPLLSSDAPDTLCIVSGYATHAMASRHLIASTAMRKRLSVDLVYGMAGSDGVRKENHIGFISLSKKKEFAYDGSFDCSYVMKPLSVHSKIYVWCKGRMPVRAFIGSANYSEKGFKEAGRIETLSECDPETALSFFKKIKGKSVRCTRANRERDFAAKPRKFNVDKLAPIIAVETDARSPYKGCQKVTIPLINSRKTLGNGSGLNWGVYADGSPRLSDKSNPKSARDRNEAYIRVPKDIASTDFFPPFNKLAKKREEQIRFTIVTDDRCVFSCVRTSGDYGKQIETPQDNAELGRYFRKRLGLKSNAYIDIDALEKYGRLDVVFYKTDDESFVMDFSRPKRKERHA